MSYLSHIAIISNFIELTHQSLLFSFKIKQGSKAATDLTELRIQATLSALTLKKLNRLDKGQLVTHMTIATFSPYLSAISRKLPY